MDKMELNKLFNEVVQDFVKKYNLSCENCLYCDNFKCKSKFNCVMENTPWINYTEKENSYDVRTTMEMYTNKPSVIDVLSGKASTEHVPDRIVNVIGAETRR